MESVEQIRDRLLVRFPAAKVELVPNPGPAAEHSLLIECTFAREIAAFLRDDEALRLDYCSNATGIDWPDKEVIETRKVTIPTGSPVAGVADPGLPSVALAKDGPGSPSPATKIIEERTKHIQPGCLEVVYHLYSMTRKHGPVILRLRTLNRSDQVTLPSLTPVWKSCDFQEREIFDLYGVVFDGHPDLRRLLMWDGFKDHPMRRDYVPPDDFEWEPTPHGGVLDRAKTHYPSSPVAGVADPGLPSVALAKDAPGSSSPATNNPEARP